MGFHNDYGREWWGKVQELALGLPRLQSLDLEEVGKSLPKDGTKDNPEGTQANHIDERI